MAQYDEATLKNMFDAPIPGESLTTNPDEPQPYETPPEYTDLETYIDDLFYNITSEDSLDGILDPVRKGVPVEDVAQMINFQAFASGKITPDLQLLAMEPTIYMILGLGQAAGIKEMVLYPEESMELTDNQQAQLLQEDGDRIDPGETPDIKEVKVPEGISKSLLNKLQKGDQVNGA